MNKPQGTYQVAVFFCDDGSDINKAAVLQTPAPELRDEIRSAFPGFVIGSSYRDVSSNALAEIYQAIEAFNKKGPHIREQLLDYIQTIVNWV